ncbi:hypothetical protein ACF0H5_021146 [Mactra antiquata]
MATAETPSVRSLYDLPTYQRRLRHVRHISLKNLQCKSFKGKDITQLQVYFTLHVDRQLKEFYRSEIITGSLNPAWQSFDVGRFQDEIDIQRKAFYLLIWVRDGRKVDTLPYLLVDWHINLSGLVFFSEKLQRDKSLSISNTVMVGMFDKYFISPEKPIDTDQNVWLVEPGTTLRGSYNINSLYRIHTVLRAISQMQVSVKKVHTSIENKLLLSLEKSKKLSAREDLMLKVGLLKSELAWQMNKLQQQKDIHDNCCKTTSEKSGMLKMKFQELKKKMSQLEEKRKHYYQIRERYIKENYELLIRKKQLISELTTYIYPITEKNKHLCICGVHLPNSEQFQGQDDTMCSVALGYTCHLVEMMSQILDIPLRYPMNHNSSKSTIIDHIHSKLNEKDQTFPLYMKGKEKFQFNYGVFLLNKNISQMRFNCGLGTVDLRLTLPNIKSLLETRLGIKFDNHEGLRPRTDLKDNLSLPSTERAETSSSPVSGGRNGSRNDEIEELEQVINKQSVDGKSPPSVVNDGSMHVPLSELNVTQVDGHVEEPEEMFKPSEDAFFKLKTTTFNTESTENSSCGSFSEQTNDSNLYARNFSLSPSPGSLENNILLVNQSETKSANSETSPGSDDHSLNQSDTQCAINLETSPEPHDHTQNQSDTKSAAALKTSPVNQSEVLNCDNSLTTEANVPQIIDPLQNNGDMDSPEQTER